MIDYIQGINMEKIRTASWTGKIWMVHGTAVISIPKNEIKTGKFKKGQMVDAAIQTLG